jgi:anthranilate/para-aminobenzoate synthase component II
MDLAKVVSVRAPYQWNEGSIGRDAGRVPRPGSRLHVVAYDFGIKRNILRLLADYGCRMTVVPAQTSAADALALAPDGIFLSNGPGDPEPCDYAIAAIRDFLETDVPVFGICLGHQLLGLASGASTMKMKFGHHGANHPVQELAGGHVLITSQNHGFAVDEGSLPARLKPTHRSLFDGSLQGIARTDRPAFGFQGHPEASPGPHDLRPLFEHFVFLMVRRLQQLLRSPALLDARRRPTARYTGDKVERTGERTGVIHGLLELRGRRVPVDVAFTLNRIGNDPYAFGRKAGFSASARLARADFGIDRYQDVIGTTIELRLEIEGIADRDAGPRSTTGEDHDGDQE